MKRIIIMIAFLATLLTSCSKKTDDSLDPSIAPIIELVPTGVKVPITNRESALNLQAYSPGDHVLVEHTHTIYMNRDMSDVDVRDSEELQEFMRAGSVHDWIILGADDSRVTFSYAGITMKDFLINNGLSDTAYVDSNGDTTSVSYTEYHDAIVVRN